MMALQVRPLLLALLVSQLCAPAFGDVAMVYTIQRHGAREVLTKTSKLSESHALGGPALLPEGERQCFDAGRDFRARYLLPSCGDQNTCLVRRQSPGYGPIHTGRGPEEDGKGFHNYNTFVRSSYTDRALSSAQAFFAGVFPNDAPGTSPTRYLPLGEQILPIYVDHDAEEDWLIRSYTKCKEYQDRLAKWFASSEFKQKQQETSSFRDSIEERVRQELQDLPNSSPLDGSLQNWWNMFDAFTISRIDSAVTPMPAISDEDYDRVKEIASWLEVSKMRSSLTGNLLGGPLLADIVDYMDQAREGVERGEMYYKLLSISSHFNTQLGVLAALELDQHAPAKSRLKWLDSAFPSFAAVMVFELHTSASNGEDFAVRLVAQDLGEEYVVVPLPCASPGDAAEQLAGEGACTFAKFRDMAAARALPTASVWCEACKAQGTRVCRREAGLAQPPGGAGAEAGTSLSGQKDSRNGGHEAGALAGAVVATFVGTSLLAAVVFYMLLRRMTHQRNTPFSSPQFMNSFSNKAYEDQPQV